MSATKQQIKTIHTLKSKLGLDDDIYREVLEEGWGVTSSKDLTEGAATDLIARMQKLVQERGGKPVPARRYDDLGKRPGYATPAQLRKIEAMWKDVSRKTDHASRDRALSSWLFSHFDRSHITMVEAELVPKIIKALRVMKGSKLNAGENDASISNEQEPVEPQHRTGGLAG